MIYIWSYTGLTGSPGSAEAGASLSINGNVGGYDYITVRGYQAWTSENAGGTSTETPSSSPPVLADIQVPDSIGFAGSVKVDGGGDYKWALYDKAGYLIRNLGCTLTESIPSFTRTFTNGIPAENGGGISGNATTAGTDADGVLHDIPVGKPVVAMTALLKAYKTNFDTTLTAVHKYDSILWDGDTFPVPTTQNQTVVQNATAAFLVQGANKTVIESTIVITTTSTAP
jgi:hypothetical protein